MRPGSGAVSEADNQTGGSPGVSWEKALHVGALGAPDGLEALEDYPLEPRRVDKAGIDVLALARRVKAASNTVEMVGRDERRLCCRTGWWPTSGMVRLDHEKEAARHLGRR
jgi:hypothetical protein